MQDFNIICQPPKEMTFGFVIIKSACRLKSNEYGGLFYELGEFSSHKGYMQSWVGMHVM